MSDRPWHLRSGIMHQRRLSALSFQKPHGVPPKPSLTIELHIFARTRRTDDASTGTLLRHPTLFCFASLPRPGFCAEEQRRARSRRIHAPATPLLLLPEHDHARYSIVEYCIVPEMVPHSWKLIVHAMCGTKPRPIDNVCPKLPPRSELEEGLCSDLVCKQIR